MQLVCSHIIRAVRDTSYDTMDVTGPQMVLTMKLTTFAWNVWDGRRPASDLDKWQSTKRVAQFPTLLEFLGYSSVFTLNLTLRLLTFTKVLLPGYPRRPIYRLP